MTHSFKVDREMLASRLSKAISFIPKKAVIPAWSNFLFSIQGGRLYISASDGNVSLNLSCDVDSKTEWSCCVPAGLTYKLISMLKENIVTFSMKTEKKIEVKSGKSKSGIALDAFPTEWSVLKIGEVIAECVLPQPTLKTALKNVKSFVNDDSSVGNYQAMNVSHVGDKMVFTGVNQQSMMCRAAVKPTSITQWQSMNIHPDTAKKVITLLSDRGDVTIVCCKDKMKVYSDPESPDFFEVVACSANTIKFPNTESLFSKMPEHSLAVNTIEFMDAVKRLSLFKTAGEDFGPRTNINNTVDPTEMVLTATDSLTDREGEESVTAFNDNKLKINRNFNNQLLHEVFASIEQSDTYLHFGDDPKVANLYVVPRVNSDQENIYTFLIAPMG